MLFAAFVKPVKGGSEVFLKLDADECILGVIAILIVGAVAGFVAGVLFRSIVR